MGVQSLFKNANLSGLFESAENFQTKIMHKAKIEVDEDGSMATATTMQYMFFSRQNNDINCNHPFMFIIHDQALNEVLFAGIYRGPKYIPSISNASRSANNRLQKYFIIFVQCSILLLLFIDF